VFFYKKAQKTKTLGKNTKSDEEKIGKKQKRERKTLGKNTKSVAEKTYKHRID
jgi:hypothetical protein